MKTIITLKNFDQQHTCPCGQTMPITEAPAHLLFDCPGPRPCPRCQGRGNYSGLLTETGTFTLMRCECVRLVELQAEYSRLQAAIAASNPADCGGLYWASGYVSEEISYLKAVLQ